MKFSSAVVWLALVMPTVSLAMVNPGFEIEAGQWGDGEGPAGWTLRLDRASQRGVVEDDPRAFAGTRAFHFSEVTANFGASQLEQCLPLPALPALRLSTMAMTERPHPALLARLRIDFFADMHCQQASTNAGTERIETDLQLADDRMAPEAWTRLVSETRLSSALGADVQALRISIRLRDRSEAGQAASPARVVWFDEVSLDAGDLVLLPPDQREALRTLYTVLDGPQWLRQIGWMGPVGSECDWEGVLCSPEGDRVLGLDLPANGLRGRLPFELTRLVDLVADGQALNLCWNAVDVPEDMAEFVDTRHLGGAPEACQFRQPQRLESNFSSHFFQPMDRQGEGVILHMLSEGSAMLLWASYNEQGQPIWLVGTGRSRHRALEFADLWQTSTEGGELRLHRAGRASLAFVSGSGEPACARAELRHSLSGLDFQAVGGRDLMPLDGLGGCSRPMLQDPSLQRLEGHYFDPAQPGSGLSLSPFSADRLLLTWFTYDDHGQQSWKFGVGSRLGTQIDFGHLFTPTGGSFDGVLQPGSLQLQFGGLASLDTDGDALQFTYQPIAGAAHGASLTRIEAGPELRASTGVRLDLELSDADLDRLYERSPFDDELVPGRVRLNGSERALALTGARFRGRTARTLPKKSLMLRFEQPQALLFGSDRANLNAMYTDPAMVRERLSFEMFHALQRPAPLTRYIDLWINGGYEGTYLHVQRIDEVLLRRYGLNPNGTLVRDQFRANLDLSPSAFGHDFDDQGAEQRISLLRENFEFRGSPQWSRLDQLIHWVQTTPPGPDFASGFVEQIDADNFIDWLLVHWLIGDTDSWGDDYWLYLDDANDQARWTFIPWDKDLSFGSQYRGPEFWVDNDFFSYESALQGGWDNLLIERVLQTPELLQLIHIRLSELLADLFTPAWFDDRLQALTEQLADSVDIRPAPGSFRLHGQNHHGALGRYSDHVEAVSDFVILRRAFIEAQVPGPGEIRNRAQSRLGVGSRETVLLTDSTGFTLAAITPQRGPDETVTAVLAVDAVEDVQGINHQWTLQLDGALPELALELFYRNDIETDAPTGNWYTGGDVPIGRQDELRVWLKSGSADWRALPTRINPYSNKAVAGLDRLEAGEHLIQLRLPDHSLH